MFSKAKGHSISLGYFRKKRQYQSGYRNGTNRSVRLHVVWLDLEMEISSLVNENIWSTIWTTKTDQQLLSIHTVSELHKWSFVK